MVSTSIVRPNSDRCFKVLIENHGMCPVHLGATFVTEVRSESLPGWWKQLVTLCLNCQQA